MENKDGISVLNSKQSRRTRLWLSPTATNGVLTRCKPRCFSRCKCPSRRVNTMVYTMELVRRIFLNRGGFIRDKLINVTARDMKI
jgi:hypothetical protein